MAPYPRPSPGPQIAYFAEPASSPTPASSEVDMIEDEELPTPTLKRKTNTGTLHASGKRAKRPRTSHKSNRSSTQPSAGLDDRSRPVSIHAHRMASPGPSSAHGVHLTRSTQYTTTRNQTPKTNRSKGKGNVVFREDEESSSSDLPTPSKEYQRNQRKYATQHSKSLDHSYSVGLSSKMSPSRSLPIEHRQQEVIEISDSDAEAPASPVLSSHLGAVLQPSGSKSSSKTSTHSRKLPQSSRSLSSYWREHEDGVLELVDSDDDFPAQHRTAVKQSLSSPRNYSETVPIPVRNLSPNPARLESPVTTPDDVNRHDNLDVVTPSNANPLNSSPMESDEVNTLFSETNHLHHESEGSRSSAESLNDSLSVPALTGAVNTLTVQDGDLESKDLLPVSSTCSSESPRIASDEVDATSDGVHRSEKSPQISSQDETSADPLLERPENQSSANLVGEQSSSSALPDSCMNRPVPPASSSHTTSGSDSTHQSDRVAPGVLGTLNPQNPQPTSLLPPTITQSALSTGHTRVVEDIGCSETAGHPEPRTAERCSPTISHADRLSIDRGNGPAQGISLGKPHTQAVPPVDYGLYGGADGHWKILFERHPEARKHALRSQQLPGTPAKPLSGGDHPRDESGLHTTSPSDSLDLASSPPAKVDSTVSGDHDDTNHDGLRSSPDELVYPDDSDNSPSDQQPASTHTTDTLQVDQSWVSRDISQAASSHKMGKSPPADTALSNLSPRVKSPIHSSAATRSNPLVDVINRSKLKQAARTGSTTTSSSRPRATRNASSISLPDVIDLTLDSDDNDDDNMPEKQVVLSSMPLQPGSTGVESSQPYTPAVAGRPPGTPAMLYTVPEAHSVHHGNSNAVEPMSSKSSQLDAIRAILRRKSQPNAINSSEQRNDPLSTAATEPEPAGPESVILPPHSSMADPPIVHTEPSIEAPTANTVMLSAVSELHERTLLSTASPAFCPEGDVRIVDDGAEEQECREMLSTGQVSDLEMSDGEYEPMPATSESVSRSRSPTLPSSGVSSTTSLNLPLDRVSSTSVLTPASSTVLGTPWSTWSDYRPNALKAIPKSLQAKDLPHSLQDDINSWPKEFRYLPHTRLVFEQMIVENTMDDEVDAPHIKLYNNVDDEPTPPWEFHYTNRMWFGEGVPEPDLSMLVGCDCVGRCDPKSKTCSCARRQRQHTSEWSRSGFLYNNDGTLKVQGAPIFECNDLCGCTAECPNRVVQHGRRCQVNIVKTPDKGWGVFAGSQRIFGGTFIGIYSGELLCEPVAEQRGHTYNRFGRTYLLDIDFHHLKDERGVSASKYTVDAYHAGNFTRYLNHSCAPNSRLNPVYINDPGLDIPLMCIFSTRNIEPGEEICFSYNGTSVDDPDSSDESDDGDFGDSNVAEDAKEGENRNSRMGAVWIKCRCGVKGCKQIMFK